MLFRNRADAGRQLACALAGYRDDPTLLVLALPRGGVPVAYEIARAFNAPLSLFLVRKLGMPGNEELAMGAIASGGVRVLNHAVIKMLGIHRAEIDRVTREEETELKRRERLYLGDSAPPSAQGRTVLLIDDGLATGMTMAAALRALRTNDPARTIAAVPVASRDTCKAIAKIADEMICLRTPEPFYGVGRWYDDFSPTSDEEVRDLLARALETQSSATPAVPL